MKHITLTVALLLAVSAVAHAGAYSDAVLALGPTSYFQLEEVKTEAEYLDTLVDTTGNDVGVATWGINGLLGAASKPRDNRVGLDGTAGYFGLDWGQRCARHQIATGQQQDLGIPSAQEYNQENMTYAFLFRSADDYGNDERVIVNVPGETNDFKVLLIGDNLAVTTSTSGWSTAFEGRTTADTHGDMTDMEWHHVVVVRNGDMQYDADVYIDGVAIDWQNECVSTGDSHGTTGSTARIGSRHPDYYAGWGQFDGNIDEVAIYSKALTAVEAGGLYDALFVPEPATMSLLVLGGLGVLLRRKRR